MLRSSTTTRGRCSPSRGCADSDAARLGVDDQPGLGRTIRSRGRTRSRPGNCPSGQSATPRVTRSQRAGPVSVARESWHGGHAYHDPTPRREPAAGRWPAQVAARALGSRADWTQPRREAGQLCLTIAYWMRSATSTTRLGRCASRGGRARAVPSRPACRRPRRARPSRRGRPVSSRRSPLMAASAAASARRPPGTRGRASAWSRSRTAAARSTAISTRGRSGGNAITSDSRTRSLAWLMMRPRRWRGRRGPPARAGSRTRRGASPAARGAPRPHDARSRAPRRRPRRRRRPSAAKASMPSIVSANWRRSCPSTSGVSGRNQWRALIPGPRSSGGRPRAPPWPAGDQPGEHH